MQHSIWRQPRAFIFGICVFLIYYFLEHWDGSLLIHKGSVWLSLLLFVMVSMIVLVVLFWMLREQKRYVKVRFNLRHRIIVTIIGFVVMFLLSGIHIMPPSYISDPHAISNQDRINALMNSGKFGVTITLLMMILGPIMEEFLFRFLIIGPRNNSSSKLRYFIRILISIVSFTSAHLIPLFITSNLSNVDVILYILFTSIPYLEASIILAYLYVHTQDVRTTLVTHISYDLLISILYLIHVG